ncbi:hypothetical protein F4805DRAFT_447379 [Annulohypoxylon moriforme]|nr:hypothetical protein F4805DRAFT_447379 [Annulohypoxylon moriforme]
MDDSDDMQYYPYQFYPIFGYDLGGPVQAPDPNPNNQTVATAIEPSTDFGTSQQVRPLIEIMMESSEGKYQGWIGSIDGFHETQRQYFAFHNQLRDPSSYNDFPSSSTEDQRDLVRTMFEAAHDVSNTYEHART